MKNPGQRNSVRIMARKLDQINKKIEQEHKEARKLQKKNLIKTDSDSANSDTEEDEEEAEEEQEEE